MDLIADCKRVIGHLSHFVMEAHESGVLSQRETETILHPLKDRLRVLGEELKDSEEGFTHTKDEEQAVVSRLTQLAHKVHRHSSGGIGSDHTGSNDSLEARARWHVLQNFHIFQSSHSAQPQGTEEKKNSAE